MGKNVRLKLPLCPGKSFPAHFFACLNWLFRQNSEFFPENGAKKIRNTKKIVCGKIKTLLAQLWLVHSPPSRARTTHLPECNFSVAAWHDWQIWHVQSPALFFDSTSAVVVETFYTLNRGKMTPWRGPVCPRPGTDPAAWMWWDDERATVKVRRDRRLALWCTRKRDCPRRRRFHWGRRWLVICSRVLRCRSKDWPVPPRRLPPFWLCLFFRRFRWFSRAEHRRCLTRKFNSQFRHYCAKNDSIRSFQFLRLGKFVYLFHFFIKINSENHRACQKKSFLIKEPLWNFHWFFNDIFRGFGSFSERFLGKSMMWHAETINLKVRDALLNQFNRVKKMK